MINKDILLLELNEIFRDVLNEEAINLNYQTTAKDIDEWDSLNHVQLVYAIEQKFKILFTAGEMQGWKNVNEMIENIQKKLN